MARISHYFTPFQTHVITQAEVDASRFSMDQALLVLEREARYKSEEPTRPGLFVYQFEALSRNRLGYGKGLEAIAGDPYYDEDWRDYIHMLRSRLGDVDFADLIYVRSAYYVNERIRLNPEFQPKFPVLFGEKEGKIARANRGRDPLYLFSAPAAPARLPRGAPPPPPRRGRGPHRRARTAGRAPGEPHPGARERGPRRRRPVAVHGQARRHRRPPLGLGHPQFRPGVERRLTA